MIGKPQKFQTSPHGIGFLMLEGIAVGIHPNGCPKNKVVGESAVPFYLLSCLLHFSSVLPGWDIRFLSLGESISF
jgi:hypothetical protein